MSEMPAMERLRIRLIAERDSADAGSVRYSGDELLSRDLFWKARGLSLAILHIDIILSEQQP